MVVDIAKFDASKKICVEWFKSKGNGDINYSISRIASYFFVPCIVVAYWIGEVQGFTPELNKKIDNLVSFYGYTKIENKPEGAP